MLFNRNQISTSAPIAEPNELDSSFINTPGLFNASVEDAFRYGGEAVRHVLSHVPFSNDRKYVVVDTKVHMLKKGMYPAIPGWHTDGVPRLKNGEYDVHRGLPDIHFQDKGDWRPHRYHLLVTGLGCLTKFVAEPVNVLVPESPTVSLYTNVSRLIDKSISEGVQTVEALPCSVTTFDWWNLHTAVQAQRDEWRLLVRVCESDYYVPQQDLRKAIRLHQATYASPDFGW